MPIDFKASQVRTNKIIASGSATRPYLLVYPSGAASDDSGGTQKLTGTGSDTWLFISGANGTETDRVVFGGAVFVSGGMIVNRQAGGGGPTIDGNFATGDFLLLNSSAQYLMFGDVSSSRVGINSGAPSGTLHVGDGDGATPGLVVDDTAIVNYGRNSDNVSTFLVRRSSTHTDHDSLFVVSSSNDRVGIRKHQPQATLDISGSVMVTGSMYISGNIYAEEFHTNIISASIIYESGSTKFGDSSDDVHQFTGSAYFKDPVIAAKISGSLTTLTDGNPYLIAGSNITLTTGSTGAVTIASTAGGGTPGGSFFTVQYNNAGAFGGDLDFVFAVPGNRIGMGVPTPKARLHVSGVVGDKETLVYTGSLLALEGSPVVPPGLSPQPIAVFGVTGTLASPQVYGRDMFFYVSGNITPAGSTSPDFGKRGTTIFGGDVVISGSLYGGSPLKLNDDVLVGGGYGSTGVTIGQTGDISANGNLQIDGISTLSGDVNFGGGYGGGSGATITTAGNVDVNGTIRGDQDLIVSRRTGLNRTTPRATLHLSSTLGDAIAVIYTGSLLALEGTPLVQPGASPVPVAVFGISGSLLSTRPLGRDTFFYVSGNITPAGSTQPDYTKRGTAVFGGDVVISGSLYGGSPLKIGSPILAQDLTGSLTKLVGGGDYLRAGTGIQLTTGSLGEVTIASTATANPAGSANQIQFSDGSSFAADTALWFQQGVGGGLYVSGNVTISADILADTNESKNIFTAVTSNAITLGGGTSRLIAGGNDIRGTAAGSLRVGVASAQVLILSGGSSLSTNPINFADTNFHVSGTVGSFRKQVKGTSTFGGDMHVSGIFAYGHEVFATKGVYTSFTNGQVGPSVPADALDGYRYVRFAGNPTTSPTCNLPAAASDTHRVLTIMNDMDSPLDTLILSSSNSNILGKGNNKWTFTLAATGSWVEVTSDGTAWVIVNGGVVPVQGVSQ